MSNPISNGLDDTLDDKNTQEVIFQGGQLSLADDNTTTFTPNDPNDGNVMNVDIPALRRSNSLRGRPHTNPLPDSIQDCFFAGKKGRMEEAVNDCKQKILNTNDDGKLKAVWLLTEIDHWDNEKERLVLLTEKTILVIKYDFVVERVKEFRRLILSTFDSVQIGVFEYPEKTLVKPRDGAAMKLSWSNGYQPSFSQMWNPWSKTIPWLILTSHPLQHTTRDSKTYQIDSFKDSIVRAINAARSIGSGQPLEALEEPIRFSIHIGLGATMYNQSRLGFSRERGGLSF